MRILRTIYRLSIQLLFPLRCPVCDGIVTPFGEKICLNCMKKLKYITPPWCLKCGKKLENDEQEYCHDCSRRTHQFLRGRALYDYSCMALSIYRFKYGGRREYADFYGEEISKYLKDFITQVKPDGLVPIPLHPSRERRRGYNQALLLANAISRYTGVPVYDKILFRVRKTVPMKQLNPRERQNNLKKAFLMKGNDVKLKVVILIDDIYTTGSTMDAAASCLMDAGVEEVYFITLSCGAGV